MSGDIELPTGCRLTQGPSCHRRGAARAQLSARVLLSSTESPLLPAFTSISLDPITGAIGRRPSGAPLYHRDSRFGPPERRRLNRRLIYRILACAEALEARTRTKGRHGGVLGGKALDVLRTLLRAFYSHKTGECFPSHKAIADAAGCCIETVRKAIRRLELAGIIETIRRKAVQRFTSRALRVTYDVAVQDSNSYVFNFPLPDRPTEGDLALPLFASSKADAKFWYETSETIKPTMPAPIDPVLSAALRRLGAAIEEAERLDGALRGAPSAPR